MIYKNQISILIQSTWKMELENSTCSIIIVSTNPNTHNAEYWSRRYERSQQSRVLEAGMFLTQHVLEWGTYIFQCPDVQTSFPSISRRQQVQAPSNASGPQLFDQGANNGAHKAPSWVLPACPRGTLRTPSTRIHHFRGILFSFRWNQYQAAFLHASPTLSSSIHRIFKLNFRN
jgi:hypothetical protein